MKINEIIKIGERTEQQTVHHDEIWDDNGNIIAEAWDEVIEVQIPIMGMVSRDATPDEIAEMEQEKPEAEPADTDARVAALEAEVKAAKDENRKLKAQVKAQNEGIAMLEECIVEMAGTVYA